MPKTDSKPMEPCEKLCSLDAPDFIQEFHSAAIQSVSTMAGAFTGLAKAFQSQNERSDHLEAKVTETNESIQFMRDSIEKTETLVKDLAAKIEEQLSSINERFEQHGREFDDKLKNLDGELRDAISDESKKVIKQMTKECKKLVAKVASAVKNTETQIKSLNKASKENQNKIQINKGSIDRIENEAKALKENLKNEMAELNTYVEKSTNDMRELVENTSEKLTSRVDDLDKTNQEFKFQTNQALDRKADVDDLKRKVDVSTFKEHQQTIQESQEVQDSQLSDFEEKLADSANSMNDLEGRLQGQLGVAETDRREIREMLEMIKKRVCDVPDPTELVQRTQQEIMDYIAQIEACLREEMKARMADAGTSNPVFGNADGTCFSCGRSPSNSSFPPMPTRSPKNSSGGGFRANSPKKAMSMKNLRKSMMESPPAKMEKSMSLPELPNKPNVPSHIQEKQERIPEKVKLPGLKENTSRPSSAKVEA